MKRIFLIILVLAVTALAFSCGDSGDTNNTNAGDGVPVAQQDSNGAKHDEEIPEPSLFTPIDADYGGYNFRMAGFYSYEGMWVAVGYSEIYAEEETGDPINDSIFRRNRTVEELYNINISLFPLSYGDRGGHATILLRSILAGDDNYDAGLVIGYQMPRLLTTPNALIELNSMQTLDLQNPWWDQGSVRELSIANQLYTVTGDMSLYGAFGTVVLYANKQLIQEYSLEDPYQLVREGTWTWDKLYDMCKAVVRDLNGDGTIGIHDQVGMSSETHSLIYSLRSGGLRLTEKDENDLPVLVGNSERMSNAIDTVVEVLRDGNVNMSSGDVSGFGNAFFEFIMPKFRDGQLLFFYHQLFTALNLREMEADFAILPAPKLDSAQENYGSVTSEWWVTYMIVPQTNSDPERTGAILDALGYYSQQLMMPAFYDVTVTHKLARDEGSVEMLDIILNNRVYDLATIYNWGDITSIFESIYTSRQNNIASALERREANITRALERTLEELLS